MTHDHSSHLIDTWIAELRQTGRVEGAAGAHHVRSAAVARPEPAYVIGGSRRRLRGAESGKVRRLRG